MVVCCPWQSLLFGYAVLVQVSVDHRQTVVVVTRPAAAPQGAITL
jgi:hypothetical protein